MKRSILLAAFLGLFLTSTAFSVNRFSIPDRDLPVNSTGHVIPIMADLDEDLYGFSVSLEFEQSKVRVTDIQLGSDVDALDPEWHDGSANNSTGRLIYGVVFSTSQATADRHLNSGAGQEVLLVTLDVIASTDTETVLNLVNRTSESPVRVNVMTDVNGDSFSPSPGLVDGDLSLQDFTPRITDLQGNEGDEGSTFFVIGENFDQDGLNVQVCNKDVDFTLLGDQQTIQVTAPSCSPGPAEVEVCTEWGCDSDQNGFMYPVPVGAPVIVDLTANMGDVGDVFFIVVENLLDNGGELIPGLQVRVCDKNAFFTLLADNQSMQVTVPTCEESGWVRVEVCNENGCDFEEQGFRYPEGTPFIRGDGNNSGGAVDLSDGITVFNDLFLGIPAPAPCRDALDANDSGAVDLSDGIFILNFLFQSGQPIPPPYPNPGLDPTEDGLNC